MRRLSAAILFIASIAAFSAAVKAQASDSPKPSAGSHKTGLKTLATDNKNEFKQLIEFMMRNGLDDRYGENLASSVGLPGARPLKGDNIRSKKFDKKRGGLNCTVVYEESPEATEYDGKRPICIFLEVPKLSGQGSENRYYRLSLDGQLEKVVLMRSKRDGDGKVIRGSRIDTEEDINSPEVKKAFAAEMADVRQWLKVQLKTQKKLEAKKTTANKEGPTAVSASAR